jgi:acyl-CoA synthetase (AMP-forming)/AMP-acid ligase II
LVRSVGSYVSGVSDAPRLGLTIGDMFDQIVAAYPDHEALVVRHQGLRYSYRQLQQDVDRCARGLMAFGLRQGERIGIWAPNRAEWTITQFATLSHYNILNNGYFTARLMRFTDQDRLVIPVPLYHCFGMVMGNLGCMSHGATMIYPSEGFEATAVLEAVQEERATALKMA